MTAHLFSIYNDNAKHTLFELVSNSLKHAFPKERKGKVSIKIDEDTGRQFTLAVHDNGIGFPQELDIQNTDTIGMQLVRDLVLQLEGTIELDRNDGTTFKITFEN